MRPFFYFCATLPVSLVAMQAGNPASPRMLSEGVFFNNPHFDAKVGFESDFILSKDIQARGKNKSGDVSTFREYCNYGGLFLDVIKRIELYALLGASELDLAFSPDFDQESREFKTRNELAYQVGVKGILYQNALSTLSLDAKYGSFSSSLRYSSYEGQSFIQAGSYLQNEWQLSLGYAYRIELFIPYIALSYSHMQAKWKNAPSEVFLLSSTTNFKTSNPWSLNLGCTLTKGKMLDLGLEVDMISQIAISLSGKIQF